MKHEVMSAEDVAWSTQTRCALHKEHLRSIGRELLLGFVGTLLFTPLAWLC